MAFTMLSDVEMARPRRHAIPKLAAVAVAAMLGIGVAEGWPGMEAWMWCLGLALAVGWFGCCGSAVSLWWVVAGTFGLVHALGRERMLSFPLAERLASGQSVEVTVVGVVAEPPVSGVGGYRFRLDLESLKVGAKNDRVRHRVMVGCRMAVAGSEAPPECGDRVRITGWMSEPSSSRNPGEFDVARWFWREQLVAELRADRLTLEMRAAGLAVRRVAGRVRDWLAHAMVDGLEEAPNEVAVIRALVLGLRDSMPESIDEVFRHAGTLHIFSVSGLHVGLVAGIFWRVFQVFRIGRRRAAWICLPLVFFYVLVTGWQPAAVRSGLMVGVVLAGMALDRPASFFNSLCLAALLILADDTQQLFIAGAQLSFVVIAAIACLGPGWARQARTWVHPDPFLPRPLWPWWLSGGVTAWEWLAQMLAVSLAAGVASAPLTLWHFQLAAPAALVANLVHVPLASLMLATAGLSVVAQAALPAGAYVFIFANQFFAQVCLVTAGWFATLPGGLIRWNPRADWTPPAACRMVIFDVGDGGALMIRTPQGKIWLIDTGRPAAFRKIILPGLAWEAVGRLDGLVLTHGDHEHAGAAMEVLSRYGPPGVWHAAQPSRSPVWKAALAQAKAIARPLAAGDVVALDDVTSLTVLWPPAGARLPLADDACLVCRLDCAGVRVMISGDAGFLAEQALVRSPIELRADVWVRGRHASDLSGWEDFVRKINASLVVATGRGAPGVSSMTPEWISMVEAGRGVVWDQSETGAVELTLHPDGRVEGRGFLSGDFEG